MASCRGPLLVVGSVASLAANVAVAEPTAAGRVIAAWPSFALIGAYELLMRQVRRGATGGNGLRQGKPGPRIARGEAAGGAVPGPQHHPSGVGRRGKVPGGHGGAGRDLQWQAWQWALANRAGDGSLR